MKTDQTGGTSGYRGYEFQVLATVWLALKLMLETKDCSVIEVEPASEEDIQAQLEVAPNSAMAFLALAKDQVELDVQVKSRDSGQWTESEFAKVLKGSAPTSSAKMKKPKKSDATSAERKRVRPIERLREKAARQYLFITNAQLHPALRDFAVDEIGARSGAEKLPFATPTGDAAALASRIGVLAQQTKAHLELQITDLLHRFGHIQPSKIGNCTIDLQNSVRRRLLKEVYGVWQRTELEAILRRHDGLPSARRELVPPAHMAEIRTRVAAGKLILTGPPGTGKTFVAEHLEYEHRTADQPFEIVHSSAGIAHIRKCLGQPGRHLFVFGDPWGLYQLEPNAQFWRGELPKLFQQANPGKRFLVTSRTGVMEQALAGSHPANFTEAEIAITLDDYSSESRSRILSLHMLDAAPWQRDLLTREESHIINELRAPLSLQEFAEALKRQKDESKVKVAELIQSSNIEVISRTCAGEVQALGSESAAAGVALWSLFMTRESVLESDVSAFRLRLKNGGYQAEIDPLKLFRWLQKSGRLIPAATGFSVHPTVMQGLELLIVDEPAKAENVLAAHLQALAAEGNGLELETLSKYIATRSLPIPPVAQNALDQHLRQNVLTLEGSAWHQAFRALTKFSHGTDPVTLLVKALKIRERSGMGGFEHWQPSKLSGDAINGIRAAPETRAIAVKFIHHVLAEDQSLECEAEELTGFFTQLNWDLSDEFFAIVIEALESERPLAMDLFVQAALFSAHPRFDELLTAALGALDDFEAWMAGFREEVQRAEQCEIDAAHATHVEEQPGERYWPIQRALNTVVDVRHKREGFRWLQMHPRRADLVASWAESLPTDVSDEELVALRAACRPSDERAFWKAVNAAGRADLASEVANGLDTMAEEYLSTCLETLCALVELGQWQAFCGEQIRGLKMSRKLACTAVDFNGKDAGEKRRLLRAVLFDPEQLAALDLCWELNDDAPTLDPEALSACARDFLAEVARQGPEALAVEALRVLRTPDQLTTECLPRLLLSPSWRARHNALLVAASRGGVDDRADLLRALDDADYRCRRTALRLLAPDANEQEKARLLSLANDVSAPVREALVRVIADQCWGEGEATLTQLIYDTRDSAEGGGIFRFSVPNYHVARAAAMSLAELGALHADTIETAIACIDSFHPPKDRFRMTDIGVPYQLLLALSRQRHPAILELYLRRLHDEWHVEGMEQSGYPLRFAAAWGLVSQFSREPGAAGRIAPSVLAEGAGHSDDRLAGPCLMALAMLGDRGFEQLVALTASPVFTIERALIVATVLPTKAKAAREAIASALPQNSPEYRFITWAIAHAEASPQETEEFLIADPEVRDWLSSIGITEGILPELRCALQLRFPNLRSSQLTYQDLFPRHLPKSIPLMTMRSMFGGE